MRIIDVLSLSTRMFRTRPLRTFLTILGVSVGIGAVLFLVSLGYGLQKTILSQITTTDSLLSLDVSSGASELISLNNDDVEKISNIPNVAEVSPVLNMSSQITIGGLTANGIAYSAEPSVFRLSGIEADFGEVFDNENEHEAVISSAGAKLFNFEADEAIGQEMLLSLFIPRINEDGFEEVEVFQKEEKYKIIGIIEEETANYVYIPSATIKDASIDKYDQLKVKVTSSQFLEDVRSEIINQGFLVSSLSETIDQANKIFSIVQIILALFGLIALLVSAIGMFNTMTIALLERINEIGIMRAVGVTRYDLIKLFLFESVIMGFLGGLGGIAVGYLAGELANIGLNILATSFGGQNLDIFFRPPWFIVFIIVFSIIIGFITGIYPSFKAARINPLEALRYK